MNVRELCPSYVASCRPDADLATAAALMREHDCGILPVVEDHHRLLGVLTDRDICMALTSTGCQATDLLARDVMTTPVYCVRFDDTAAHALKVMRQHRVRRLPVTEEDGTLGGILSLNDLVLAAGESKGTKLVSPTYEEVMRTLKTLCERRPLAALGRPRQEVAKV
jgi:CBS domain-containing protein